jgi:hypothetical protein
MDIRVTCAVCHRDNHAYRNNAILWTFIYCPHGHGIMQALPDRHRIDESEATRNMLASMIALSNGDAEIIQAFKENREKVLA